MLKSILTTTLVIMFVLATSSCTVRQEVINNVPANKNPSIVVQQKGCNEVDAIADIMFGEGENQPLQGKKDLGWFLISEANKAGRSLCKELNYRMPGGHLKYTSMHSNLKNKKADRPKSYANIKEIAKEFWKNDADKYHKMDRFNHYITLDLAKKRPPKWFKYYIVEYYISGDHVFVNLDFKDKVKTKKSGKYLPNYQKLLKEIEGKS